MKWHAREARRAPGAVTRIAGARTPGREAQEGGTRLQRAASRLRLSLPKARDDLGHSKHLRRWLARELSN